MPGIGSQAFWERYEQVKAIEHRKNELIEVNRHFIHIYLSSISSFLFSSQDRET